MRHSLLFFLLLVLSLGTPLWAQQDYPVAPAPLVANPANMERANLAYNTRIPVRLVSGQTRNGRTEVQATVARNVRDDRGRVLIAIDTPVEFTLNKTERAGVGEPARISIGFSRTRAADGTTIALGGSFVAEGESRMWTSVGLTVATFFLFPPFNFLFLTMKGGRADLPADLVAENAYVRDDYPVWVPRQ